LLDLPVPVDLFVDLAAAGNWASVHCTHKHKADYSSSLAPAEQPQSISISMSFISEIMVHKIYDYDNKRSITSEPRRDTVDMYASVITAFTSVQSWWCPLANTNTNYPV